MIKRSPRSGAPDPVLGLWRTSYQDARLHVSRMLPPRPSACNWDPARLLPSLLPIAFSVLFAGLQDGVTAITSALSWVVLVGNALAGLLFLWDSLRSTPRSWYYVVGSSAMLLIALMSSLTYTMVRLSAGTHPSWFPLLLPLASSALIAGVYTLTAPQRGLTLPQRALVVTFLMLTGVNLLGLFLADLWGM